MHEIKEIKSMLKDELRDLTQKGELTAGSLETVDKLLNSIKNACKIEMYDEYQGDDYSTRGYSRARGRGSDANRDSRGRYSSDGYNTRRGVYSYDDGSEDIIEALRHAMEQAETEQEKTTIRKIIRRMENG